MGLGVKQAKSSRCFKLALPKELREYLLPQL
jgi:hypothetical protein